jgi:hypothetical protein
MAVDGLTTLRSSRGPKDTMNRLEAEVKARGVAPADAERLFHLADQFGRAASGL